MSGRGLLITVEGIDGSGKSTQTRLLGERLRAAGEKVRLVRDPGTTALGERVREILLQRPGGEPLTPFAELALFLAARAQLLQQVIDPALAEGEVVLSDRFLDSTLAYQGEGRGLDQEALLQVHRLLRCDRLPDLTLLLDLPVEVARARFPAASSRDRMEAEPTPYHERVRRGYLGLARRFPERLVVLRADLPASEVAESAWAAVRERLAARSPA